MIRLLLILLFVTLSSCVNEHKSSTYIAIIRGESLNYRIDTKEPAPYESRIAFECLELETKPVVKFYSRNRALELFKSGQLDVVVSGQAAEFPDEFSKNRRIKAGTRSVILYKEHSRELGELSDLPNGVKVGVLENSVFASDFVKRAGEIELKVYRSVETAVESLKTDKIECLVIDQIAVEHISPLLPGIRTRVLDLPSKALVWLYR